MKETAPFAGGTGSREDPFLISTPQQFDHIREYRSQCFRLINDLDFLIMSEKMAKVGGLWANGEVEIMLWSVFVAF